MGLRRRKSKKTATQEEIPVQGCVELSEDSSMESGPKRDSFDSQGSSTDSSQNPDTDEERLSVRSHVQQWVRRMGSLVLRKTTSRSRGPSPHCPQNPGTEDERPSVQGLVQQWEGHIMRSAAEKDPASRSQGSLNIPTSEGETLSVQRPVQMWEQGTRQALAEGDPALSTQSPVQAEERPSVRERTVRSQEMLNEQRRREREESENLVIEKLQGDLHVQRQTDTDLQQQLSSAKAPIVELRDADQMWRQRLQEEREKKEEEVMELIAKMQEAIKELQIDLHFQRQTNTDLQQELSSANAALVELKEVNEAWGQAVQEEREEKEEELMETKAKMQEAIEDLQIDLQFTLEANIDLQQQLSSAKAAFAELKDANEAWRQSVQKEREKKELESMETIAKMQEGIEELQGDLHIQREANTDLQQQLSSANAAITELRDAEEAWRAKMQEAANRQEQQESELEMFREEKRRKEERKRRRWWRFWRCN